MRKSRDENKVVKAIGVVCVIGIIIIGVWAFAIKAMIMLWLKLRMRSMKKSGISELSRLSLVRLYLMASGVRGFYSI